MKKKTSPFDRFVDELGKKNMTVAEWSRVNEFDRHKVYAILRGRIRGQHGEARRIVERMGVTPPPVIKVRASAAN